MESALVDRIDPFITPDNLALLASRAVGHEVRPRRTEVLTGGCWNRVVGVDLGDHEPDLVFKISARRAAPGMPARAATSP